MLLQQTLRPTFLVELIHQFLALLRARGVVRGPRRRQRVHLLLRLQEEPGFAGGGVLWGVGPIRDRRRVPLDESPGGERRDVAGRRPRARAHLRRELGHPLLPSRLVLRRLGSVQYLVIRRQRRALQPAPLGALALAREPLVEPLHLLLLLAHRVHGGALRRIEQRLMRLLDDVKGGGGVGVLALVRVDQQTHAPVRLLEHRGGGLLGGHAQDVVRVLTRVGVRGQGLVGGCDFRLHPGELRLLDNLWGRRSDGFGGPRRSLSRGGVEHRPGRDHRSEHAFALGAQRGGYVVRVGSRGRADDVGNRRGRRRRSFETEEAFGAPRRVFSVASCVAASYVAASCVVVVVGVVRRCRPEQRVGLLAGHRPALQPRFASPVGSVRLHRQVGSIRLIRFLRLLRASPRRPRPLERRELLRGHVEYHRQPRGRLLSVPR